MKKIVKFGGSSLANAEQFQKVGEIIRSDESRRYVVTSAPGKRFDGDTKVTDLLYKCYNTAVEGEDFIPILQENKGRYYEIIFLWKMNLLRSKVISRHRQVHTMQHPEENFSMVR